MLGLLGYTLETDWRPARFELAAPPSRYVDMHPVVLEDDGNGLQTGFDGATFTYPAAAFTTGVVAGRPINCISVDLQLDFHTGYDPREVDRADLEQLHDVAAGNRPC